MCIRDRNITENTLVIIVDTHINSSVESVDVLNKASKVVVFDHHRKSTDFIDKAVMVYHEPYASSACELVTEMIQYIGEKVKLKSAEADALLAGMTVDTQNFSMKTGTITFLSLIHISQEAVETNVFSALSTSFPKE